MCGVPLGPTDDAGPRPHTMLCLFTLLTLLILFTGLFTGLFTELFRDGREGWKTSSTAFEGRSRTDDRSERHGEGRIRRTG